MSRENNKLPRLRFPEFRDAGDWEEKRLGEVSKYENGKAHEKNITESGSYIVVNSKFISTDGAVRKFSDVAFCVAAKEDILMVLSDVPNGRAIAKCFQVDTDNLYSVNQRICKITPTNTVSAILFYSLNRNSHFLAFDDGVKQTNLKKDDVLECPIILPESTEEQQKIAACLSSLDELITAQTQKLAHLKTHKKGLMQQLFPAEGETQPKLRFPEFQDAGDWEVNSFYEFAEIIDGDRGKNYPKAHEFYEAGYCLFLNAKNVTKNGFRFDKKQFISKEKDSVLRKGKLKRADVILTTRGTVGQFAYFSEEVPYENMRINSGMVILRIKAKNINADYFYAYSKSEILNIYIKNIAFGNAQQQVTVTEIEKFQLHYPHPKEQQKIADCLSSLDELITAQTQKLAKLKTHKKGLMQQLFPAADEVNG